MHGILHVRIRGGTGRVTARVYPTPMRGFAKGSRGTHPAVASTPMLCSKGTKGTSYPWGLSVGL